MSKIPDPPELVEKRKVIADQVNKAIIRAISEYGYTEERIQAMLGISGETMKKYRRGETNLDAGQLFFIASISRLPYSYFFGESSDPFTETKSEIAQLREQIANLANASPKSLNVNSGNGKPSESPEANFVES